MDEATVKRIVSQRRVMAKVQKHCDKHNLPYPSELIAYLMDSYRVKLGGQ